MTINKLKKLIAAALVVSITIPTINVQALENVNNEVESITSDLESTTNKNESENIENTSETNVDEEDKNVQESEVEIDKEELESNNEVDDNNSAEETIENSNEELEKEEDISGEEVIKTDLNDTSDKEEVDEVEEVEEVEEVDEVDESELKGQVYKKKKLETSQSLENSRSLGVSTSSSDLSINEPEEYKMKKEQLDNLEVLVNMTDANYELAIANSDGSYEFVEAYDDLNEAKAASAELVDSKVLGISQQPAVINSSGEIVYTNFVMGRMIIFRNNLPTYSGNINLYTTSDLTSAFTYTNVGYMEDVPVLEMTDTAAKIMVNGYVGWIANNINSGNYNMKLIPRNQVKNPSYYTVKNGDLVHFISANMESSSAGGTSLVIGKAPSYLKEGSKYLSYDGNYFYEYNSSTLESKLNTLIGEYRTGSRMGSVNRSSTFYNYYQYLSFRSKTEYTAAELDKFINNNTVSTSKLRGLGATLKNAENKYGVNALIMLGVAMNESALGTSYYAMTRNNLFGIAAFDSDPDQATTFDTPGDSVLEFAKNYISAGYADPSDWRYYGGFLGNKYRGVNIKYASDPYWGEKAAQHAYSIDKYLSGGNTNLKDTNSKFIGTVKGSTSVINRSGTELYKISTNLGEYASYNDVTFVINSVQKVTINGKEYYEINPEITNQLYTNNKVNNFDGAYNWNVKGYVLASAVTTLNVVTPTTSTISGSTRYETAVGLSKSQFTKSEYVVMVNGEAAIDGVSASALASGLNAPILLTKKNEVPTSVITEIKRLGATKAILVGGTSVITTNVSSQLEKNGITSLTRLGGSTRYTTALEVAKYIDKNLYDVSKITVAGGEGEADALSISPVSVMHKMPVILVEKDRIPSEVSTWIKSENIQNAYIIGGSSVVSSNTLVAVNNMVSSDISGNRLGGINRYETNALVINKFFGSGLSRVYLTVGDPLADALGAGVVAGLNNSPIVLTTTDLTQSQRSALASRSADRVIQVGGKVSTSALQSTKDLLSGTN